MTLRIVPSITEPVRAKYQGHRRSPWSPRELQVLRERYIHEGLAGCAPLLPDRADTAIAERARKLGLVRQPKSDPIAPTPELDRAIRTLYATGRKGKGWMKAFCARHHVGRQWVLNRARALGCVEPRFGKAPTWSAAEDEIIQDGAHLGTKALRDRLIRAGHPARSESAIALRRKRIGLSVREARESEGIYSAHQAAALLGMDLHQLLRELRAGRLKGRIAGQAIDGQTTRWEIRRKHVRQWMFGSMAWQPGRCDRLWLLDILSDSSPLMAAAAEEAA